MVLSEKEKYIPILVKVVKSNKNFGLIGRESLKLCVHSIELDEETRRKHIIWVLLKMKKPGLI